MNFHGCEQIPESRQHSAFAGFPISQPDARHGSAGDTFQPPQQLYIHTVLGYALSIPQGVLPMKTIQKLFERLAGVTQDEIKRIALAERVFLLSPQAYPPELEKPACWRRLRRRPAS